MRRKNKRRDCTAILSGKRLWNWFIEHTQNIFETFWLNRMLSIDTLFEEFEPRTLEIDSFEFRWNNKKKKSFQQVRIIMKILLLLQNEMFSIWWHFFRQQALKYYVDARNQGNRYGKIWTSVYGQKKLKQFFFFFLFDWTIKISTHWSRSEIFLAKNSFLD